MGHVEDTSQKLRDWAVRQFSLTYSRDAEGGLTRNLFTCTF